MPVESKSHSVYRAVIQRVMVDPETLPSLPAITMDIRTATNDVTTSSEVLASLCSRDPAFSALLLTVASSPLYMQASPPTTLSGVISLLGMPKVSSLCMAHTIKGMFVLRSPVMKNIYQQVWSRLIMKSGVSAFLSARLRVGIPEQAMLAALLSDVGTLSILSAFREEKDFPGTSAFYRLCREFSKGMGVILLKKWKINESFVHVVKHCGRWRNAADGPLDLLDVVNLGLYSTVQIINKKNNLSPLINIPSYMKLEPPENDLDETGSLLMVAENLSEIECISQILR